MILNLYHLSFSSLKVRHKTHHVGKPVKGPKWGTSTGSTPLLVLSPSRMLCVYSIYCIALEHWPDTCEFITWSDEFWYMWIRFSCLLQLSIYLSCPLNKHVTHILQCIGPCNLFCSFRSIFVYNSLCDMWFGLQL